jgi:hypothetical protein
MIDVALGVLLAIAILAVLVLLFAKRDAIAGILAIGGIGAAVYYLPWRSLAQWVVIILFLTGIGLFIKKRDRRNQPSEQPYKDAIDREFEKRKRF